MKVKNFVTQLLFIYLDAKPVSLAEQRIPIFGKKKWPSYSLAPPPPPWELMPLKEILNPPLCLHVGKIWCQKLRFGILCNSVLLEFTRPGRSQIYRFFRFDCISRGGSLKNTNSKRTDIHKMLRHFTTSENVKCVSNK